MRTVIQFKGKTLTIEGVDFKDNHKETWRYVLEVATSLSLSLTACNDREVYYSLANWQYILGCRANGVGEEYIVVNNLKTMVIK